MNILVVMIPLSLILLAGAAAAFFWAVDHDQFDDLDSPGLLPLADRDSSDASDCADDAEGRER
jgi:cbb3-type cytochrome oxidase maturation protein